MARILKVLWFVMLFALAMNCQSASAQLDGLGIAPDFTLTDIDGNSHHLYDYLDQGKVVVLDFFAVWCSICQADASYLEEVYLEFGPAGSNKIEMLSLEADEATTDLQTRNYALNFNASNPFFNTTEQVPVAYKVNFFPSYYVVAPDRSYSLIGGRQQSMKDLMVAAINNAPGLRTVANDLRVTAYSKPKGSMCSREVFPEITIQNYGKNTITSLQVETLIDGESTTLYSFTDSIEPYHYAELRLPWLVDLSKGWHTIEFVFVRVNDQADGDTVDGISGGDFLILPDGDHITVSLTTDAYPKESYWRILDNNKLVAEASDYDKGLTTESREVCVEVDSCYRLVLYDSFGDGMSSGGLEITYHDKVIGSIDALSFSTDSVWIDFCVKSSSTAVTFEDIQSMSSLVFPNPGSGEFLLKFSKPLKQIVRMDVLNTIGETILSINLQQGSINVPINLANSPAGLYFVRLKSDLLTETHRVILSH